MSFSQSLWNANQALFQSTLELPFNQELAAGTLGRERFCHYMIQDAHYLVAYGRALAVTAAKGSTLLPNVPAIGKTLPGFDITSWNGIFGPAGLPPAVVQRLNTELQAVLVAVPSQLLLMLQWAQRRHCAPVAQVQLVLISGARWMREHTPALRQLFPQARIVEFYGASEASYVAWMDASEDAPPQAVGRPFSNVALRIGEHPYTPVPQGEAGRIWVRSPMLFMDYVHALDGSAAELHDGWLTVRDMGWLDAAGQLYLCGRESRMLVTQGKNLFPEEVEAWLLAQPGVAQASVIGLPDALRGLRIHAVLHGADLPAATALAAGCRAQLEAFKTPRRWWRWQGAWPQTRSGKTDTATLQAAVAQALAGQPPAALQPWR